MNSTDLTFQWWNDGTNLIIRLETAACFKHKREENNLLSTSDSSAWSVLKSEGGLTDALRYCLGIIFVSELKQAEITRVSYEKCFFL